MDAEGEQQEQLTLLTTTIGGDGSDERRRNEGPVPESKAVENEVMAGDGDRGSVCDDLQQALDALEGVEDALYGD